MSFEEKIPLRQEDLVRGSGVLSKDVEARAARDTIEKIGKLVYDHYRSEVG